MEFQTQQIAYPEVRTREHEQIRLRVLQTEEFRSGYRDLMIFAAQAERVVEALIDDLARQVGQPPSGIRFAPIISEQLPELRMFYYRSVSGILLLRISRPDGQPALYDRCLP